MATKIIEGVPGSGKTYYAVRHVAKTFFKKQKDGSYVLNKEITLITNIDSFKPDHISLQDEIKHAGGVQNFFSINYQEKFKEGKPPIVYIIDEAQRLFRKGARNLSEVFSYFEYHRHWGQDIYLVTQNTRKLPPDIVTLTEYIIRAAPRVRSLLGEFKYKWISDGEVIKREAFKPSQSVFALYRSMEQDETEKISNPIMKTVGIVVIITICLIFGGLYFFKKGMFPDKKEVPVSTVAESVSSSSSIVPVSSGENTVLEKKELSELVYFVALDTATSGRIDKLKTTIFWKNQIFSLASFPYRTIFKGSRWYAVLKSIEFETLFSSEDESVNYFVLADNS